MAKPDAKQDALAAQPAIEPVPCQAAEQDEVPRRGIVAATAHRALAMTDPALLKQAKAKAERRLAADPEDADALRRLADLQRKGGEVDAASETYRKLTALTDDAVAAWAVGALNDKAPLPNTPEGIHPVPFLRVANFLTAAQQDVLFEAVGMGPEHFEPAGVYNGDGRTIDLDFRVAAVAERPVRRQIRPWFVEELMPVARRAVERFGIDDMQECHVEFQVTAHRGGGFFRPHRDNTAFKDRQISYIYYFYAEPKPFVGGELLLYDTSLESSRFHRGGFSRIEPARNSLVLFPSSYYHEVLPVRCESESFEDSRFTVNGWLHRASDWEAQLKKDQAEAEKAQAEAEKEQTDAGKEQTDAGKERADAEEAQAAAEPQS